jgi:Tol biopolymer transport system component
MVASKEQDKRVILLLLTFIFINPFIVFIVSDSIIYSIGFPALSVLLVQSLYQSKISKRIVLYCLNLMFLVSIFLYGEAVFINNFKEYIIEDLYEFKGKYYFNLPYLDKRFNDKEFQVHYKTNKQGFRISKNDDPDLTAEQVDWLFLGDSYTQGAQVQYEELYTSQLYSHFPDKTIVNAGISGFGLPDEYNYYISEGRKLKPKKVFLQICNFNDFMNVKERQAGFSDYLMQYSGFTRFLLYGFKYANPAELPLGRWTEPFYPDEDSNQNYNVFYKETSTLKKQDLIRFSYFLRKLNEEVKKDGAELVILQIPTKEQIYYKYFEEVINSFKVDPRKLDMDLPNKYLAEEAAKSNIQLLDLRNDFQESEVEVFYQFDEHLNAHGHKTLANAIAKLLQSEEAPEYEIELVSNESRGERYPTQHNVSSNILYQAYVDGNHEIFISDSLFQETRRLTFNSVDETHPWLSPDGSNVVFTEGSQADGNTKVVAMNIDGSNRRYVTDREDIYGAIPSISSNGKMLTYAEWTADPITGFFVNPYIVVINLDKGSKRIITDNEYESWRPIFSPDNKFLFYISKKEKGQFDIYQFNLETGEEKNLTNTPYDEWDPAISANGKLLAYAAEKDDNWDLFLRDLSSSSECQLTRSIGDEWDPTFSKAGDYIFFAATYGLKNGIYKLNLEAKLSSGKEIECLNP